MKTIKQILIERDGMNEKDAIELIEDAKNDFYERLAAGESPYDICEEWFGLEPDYIFEIIG